MRKQLKLTFDDIASLDNLLAAWGGFVRGKRSKKDVQAFNRHLMDNLMELHYDLMQGSYHHGPYAAFSISDPKPRSIHKASVRDRVLHHAIYRKLYPFFDRTFIADSYSCRLGKGTHKALRRFRALADHVSQNHTRTCWVLKCDVTKFFASIDQAPLLGILSLYIPDQKILWLLGQVITSFNSGQEGTGLPLGNLTSQLLVNIYMNELDQHMKHKLKAQYYIRYADDFVLLSYDRQWLGQQIRPIQSFLEGCLHLSLHPRKVSIETIASGVDFLGWVHFPHHTVLRTTTKRRMMHKLQGSDQPGTLQSYLGLMRHGDTHELQKEVLGDFWTWK